MASEGKIVVKSDELLKKHSEWAKGEASDASGAGKRREAIGAYADQCGIENKALSQFRAGLKIKNEGKQKDWLNSLEALLPVARAEIYRNEPGLPLDDANQEKIDAAAAVAADQSNQMAADAGVGGDVESETDPGDHVDGSDDSETAEFNEQVDEAMGGDDTVTPIDFGGDAA